MPNLNRFGMQNCRFFTMFNAHGYDLYKVQQKISISEKNIDILKTIERIALVKFRTASLGGSGSSSQGSTQSTGVSSDASSGSRGMGGMGGNAGNPVATATNPMPQVNSMGASTGWVFISRSVPHSNRSRRPGKRYSFAKKPTE